jgi:hypothetical protein
VASIPPAHAAGVIAALVIVLALGAFGATSNWFAGITGRVYSAEELERAEQRAAETARREGYAESHDAGAETGYESGWSAGYDEGYDGGYMDGWDEGWDDGYYTSW